MPRRARISLSEWMILGGIALIFFSFFACSYWMWTIRATKLLVMSDFGRIERACGRYLKHYNKMPMELGLTYDFHFGLSYDLPNSFVINALRGAHGEGNTEGRMNPEQADFLKAQAFVMGRSGIDVDGNFLDPWGNPYQIILDLDGNRICDMAESVHDRALGKMVASWSFGPDQEANTSDDILSWRR